MRRFLLPLILCFFATSAIAQSVPIDAPVYGTSGNAPLGTSNYAVNESIYYESEIGAGNFITAGTAIDHVDFSANAIGAATAFNNVKIYMMNIPGTTTTLATANYSTAGYTLVFDGTINVTSTGWVGVDLATPFVRTAGSNLQVMVERTDNVAHAGFVFNCVNPSSGPLNCRRYNNTTAITATTSLAASAFRPAIRLRHNIALDAGVSNLVSVGKLPLGYGGSRDIVVTVANNGTSALTNLPVTLNVTGANTYSNTQTVASLASGASTTVTFSGFAPTATGANVLTVTVPTDGDNGNNSVTQNQVTTASTYALSNDDAFTAGGSIGFNQGSGNLLVKMPAYKASTLTSIRVSITTETSAVGNTVYGVLLSSTGTIIAQTPNYVIQNADLGNYVTFTFAAAQALTAGTTYYIGLAQTANATGYYPVNTQGSKPNAAHSTVLAGGAITDYTTFGSLMIEGVFSNVFPVTISSFTGTKQGSANLLKWTTTTEVNNRGFELQRSADGVNFSSIGFVATKAEGGNSTATLNYSFTDSRTLAGTNYYRLQQVDLDGKTSYSSIVTLKGEKAGLTISAAYPNPTKENVRIMVSSPVEEKANISVTDITGKVVKQLSNVLVAGENNININVSSLAAGTYYIRLVSGSEIRTAQFIKQ